MSRLTLLNRVTRHPLHHVIEEIDEYHARAGMTVVNFLYYANFRRFWNHARYIEALRKSDFLLPDGIALRLFIVRLQSRGFLSFLQDRKKSLRDIPNLNGTDFIPNFLSAIHTQRTREILVFLYGGQEGVIEHAGQFLGSQFPRFEIISQNGFTPFDFERFRAICTEHDDRDIIMLVGLGTPKQELWIEEHREKLAPFHPLIFSVGGLFDFLGGAETRAPLWIRKINGEWIYRVFSNPKKNFMKTLRSLRVFVDLVFPPKG